MYLNKLKSEQKELFLDLCIHAANVDDKFSDQEKETIQQYCAEMMIPERFEAKYSNEEVLEKLKAISYKNEMRIIFIEITALVLSDNVFDDKEKAFVDKIAELAELTEDDKKKIINLMKELYVVYNNLSGFIAW